MRVPIDNHPNHPGNWNMGSHLEPVLGEQIVNRVGEAVREEGSRPIEARSLVVGAMACRVEEEQAD